MPAKQEFSKVGFLKSYLLPLLMIIVIPGFGLWFFDHVESWYDNEFRQVMLTRIQQDRELTDAQRQRAIEIYQKVSVSKILASNKPEAKELQQRFVNVQFRYATFRWMKRIALVCL